MSDLRSLWGRVQYFQFLQRSVVVYRGLPVVETTLGDIISVASYDSESPSTPVKTHLPGLFGGTFFTRLQILRLVFRLKK